MSSCGVVPGDLIRVLLPAGAAHSNDDSDDPSAGGAAPSLAGPATAAQTAADTDDAFPGGAVTRARAGPARASRSPPDARDASPAGTDAAMTSSQVRGRLSFLGGKDGRRHWFRVGVIFS